MKKVLRLTYLLVTIIFFISCDNSEENIPTTGLLTVNLDGLEELGANFVYEGWLIVDGNPVSTGTFTSIDFPQSYNVDINDLQNATKFVLSIESAIDNDPLPAATKILAGDFVGSNARVNSDNIVISTNSNISSLSDSWGKYILATPTDSDDSNEASGVWFLDNTNMPAIEGLGLPILADGWKYEGWVVLNGTPVSTGTFTVVDEADDNASISPYKGSISDGPGYPGEDYLMGSAAGVNFPTDLKESTIVISVEPSPDNSVAPFTLKPLAHVVPVNAMNHTVINMVTGPKNILSGSVSR
ncbi:anti-sigma factor [Polaribacter ponticola]|uniref:Anti-sigma factor n=1 Tax=Polaribacter ponticola TaxID=2978475 RepID=A0ABT5SEZ5_9FLAO|nr:anti-sigma factor [Polaribacter sp. MSW5]MDD7916006.1 anti-sigma factor [Polaribacter sp. MSW5]